jgi:histidinol phosphate phosphatase hisN-like protein
MSTITPSEARAQLEAGGVTGTHHSHSRQNTVAKVRALVEGDEDGAFGLSGATRYSASEVLSFLAELTGCSPDIDDLEGFDTIDPVRTIDGITAAARRLVAAATKGATLLSVTGHPTGMLEHHIRVVDAYRKAGGKIVRLREEEQLAVRAGRHFEVRYIGSVGCMADWGSLRHTHSAKPMEMLLEGEPWPDIVLGDHGFAGAAIERGIPTIAVMDINDPALAVAWAEKKDVTIIPMDDNRPPRLYEPSWRLFEQALLGGAE